MTFRAPIHRTDPQFKILEVNFGLFEKHCLKENEPKKTPKYTWDRKVSGLFLRNKHQLIPWELLSTDDSVF